jgi:hypothetical protein
MKKKVVVISILAVLMLVAISYATAVNSTNVEKKESPLYRLRTRQAIGEKINIIIKIVKTKLLEGRIFFLPSQKEDTRIFLTFNPFCKPMTCGVQHPPCLPTSM